MADYWYQLTELLLPKADRVWLLRTLVGAIAVALMWKFWGSTESHLRALVGLPPSVPEVTKPPSDWQGTEIVRVWTLPSLRRARVVAPGTRLAIVDRGVVQFELPAGSPLPGRLDALARKHALSSSAQAIQFPAAVVDINHVVVGLSSCSGQPVDAIIKLHVGVDPRSPQRLVESAPMRDGVISVSEVQSLIEDAVRPWLQARAEQIDEGVATNSVASLANEMETFLRSRFFDPHGLVGGVRALTFQRALAPA